MKTKNSKLFGLLCLLLLSVAEGQAQTYPYVTSGNTIVSRDAAGGVKAEALLTTEQKTFLMDQTTQPIYNEKSDENRVSAKFEVASTNAPTDASAGETWATAYTLCKSYSQADAVAGSWRLPTQRELMLICMFKSQLTGCGTLPTVSGGFWSSTEYSSLASNAWYVSLSGGYTNFTDVKGITTSVRCVRDL